MSLTENSLKSIKKKKKIRFELLLDFIALILVCKISPHVLNGQGQRETNTGDMKLMPQDRLQQWKPPLTSCMAVVHSQIQKLAPRSSIVVSPWFCTKWKRKEMVATNKKRTCLV